MKQEEWNINKRDPIKVSEFATINEQGLLDDYTNAWASILMAATGIEMIKEESPDNFQKDVDFEEYNKILNKERENYRDYLERSWPDRVDEIIAKSDSDKIKEINDLVEKYNLLARNNGITPRIAKHFMNLMNLTIYGKERRGS